MGIKIIFSNKSGLGWADAGFESPTHFKFILGPFRRNHIYLSPTRSLSGLLNTPSLD